MSIKGCWSTEGYRSCSFDRVLKLTLLVSHAQIWKVITARPTSLAFCCPELSSLGVNDVM